MTQSWITNYWQILLNESYESQLELKEQYLPKTLFRYRGLVDMTIDCIKHNYIWLADIATLNDPFECSIQIDREECLKAMYFSEQFKSTVLEPHGIELTEIEKDYIKNSHIPVKAFLEIFETKGLKSKYAHEEYIERFHKTVDAQIAEENKDVRICSFCEINDSMLLWSHYADNHRGICIEYDLADAEPDIGHFLYPIVYGDEVYKLKLFEELTDRHKTAFAIRKYKDWEYEKEWRIVVIRKDESFPQKMPVSNPKAIYLGTRFYQNSETHRERLLKILSEKNIPVIQMINHSDKYKLTL